MQAQWDTVKGLFGQSLATVSFKIDQANVYNLRYSGPLYLGTPLQNIPNIVWDTGSRDLLVESTNCPECQNLVFKNEDSTSFRYDSVNVALAGVEYADGTALKGKWSYDSACLANDAASCASDFHFITITEQAGL